MLKISQTPAFIRDYKGLVKKHFNKQLLKEAVSCLAAQDKETLARKYRDHALSGNWKGFRELHVEKNPYR